MNQKGMSLIEVVASLAIMSIVVVMVFRFVSLGLSTSTNVTESANVQKEAQTSLSQMKDWIMEANKGIVCYGATAYYDKAVAIYNKGEGPEENFVHLIFYRKSDGCLYYEKAAVSRGSFSGSEADITALAQKINRTGKWKEGLFSQYVSEFSVTIPSKESQQVTIHIGYQNKKKAYQADIVVKMRNVPEEDPAKYDE